MTSPSTAARAKTTWLKPSLELLKAITLQTHNDEIAPIAMKLWKRQLQPDNPLWDNITAKPFSISNKAHVVAMIDPRLPGLGLVGFFGCTEVSAGSQALSEACDWLKEQGIEDVYGPINGTITKSYRFNLSDDHRVPGEPVNPSFYIDAFRQAGFGVFNRYVSGITKHYRLFNKLFVRVPKKEYSRLTVRAFGDNNQIEDLKIYHALMNQIFPSQSVYCPDITWEERHYNMSEENPIFNSRYSYFLEDNGKPIGMLVAQPYQNKLCIDLLGLLPEYRGHNVAGLLIRKVHERASQDNLEAAIYALIRVGNRVYKMRRPGVKVYRRYITMRKRV